MTKGEKTTIVLTIVGMLAVLFVFYGAFTAQQATIETHLTIIQRDIADLTATVSDLPARVAQLETKISLAQDAIRDLQSHIRELANTPAIPCAVCSGQ